MNTKDVITHFGSVNKAANALGISRTAIYLWAETVPRGRQFELHVLSGGKLVVDPLLAEKAA